MRKKLFLILFSLALIFLSSAATSTSYAATSCSTIGAKQCPNGQTGYQPYGYYQVCNSNKQWQNVSCGSEYCYSSGANNASCVGGCSAHTGLSCSTSCTNPSSSNYYCAPGTGVCCSGTTPPAASGYNCVANTCSAVHSGTGIFATYQDCINSGCTTSGGSGNNPPPSSSGPSGCPVCPANDTWDPLAGKCLQPLYNDSTGQTNYTQVDPISYETCTSGQLCYLGCGCNNSQCPNNNELSKGGIPTCLTTGNGKGCNTAIGYIDANFGAFTQKLFEILLALGGGLAVILIIISGYRLMMSQGNPESVQNARNQLAAAIVGLLFIIFSLVVLQTIGVDIINLPGFGK